MAIYGNLMGWALVSFFYLFHIMKFSQSVRIDAYIIQICNSDLKPFKSLQSGPIDHGKIEGSDWLDLARPVIQKRMEKYSSGEIGFNLLGVCQDKLEALEKQLAEETTEFKQRFEILFKILI